MNGTCVLVCSSWNGAVALVRRGDKKCLFYAAAPGAHSADLVGTDLLAAATSKEDGELRLYSLKGPKVLDAQPLWSTKLSWGHGVVWDAPRKELWALGTSELLKLRVSATTHPSSEPATQPVEASATVLQRWELPASGGHDLYPYDADHLVVTSGPMSWLFDVATGQFSPLPGLADRKGLISVSRNTQTGQVMFTQTVGETSHADHLGFACQKDLSLPYKLLYKARWNTPAPR